MTEQAVLETVYNPRAVEFRIHDLWEEAKAFRSDPAVDSPKGTFTIVIPPPNVTGVLHLGHALNNTLQDILIRYHRMCGFNTLWQPGTDHAGIATQAVVERRILEQEGKTRHELGREELVRRIWQWKDDYEDRILQQLKQMGCSCDWERNRFTLDEGLARAVRQQFFALFKDGLIFRGKRLVNWDTQLQTAVSDDEVYYENVKGHFWHFKYPVIDPKTGEPEFIIIATTRPETMLGDTAVAVHPDPEGFIKKRESQLNEKCKSSSGKVRAEIESKLEILGERRELSLKSLIQLRDMAVDGRKLRLPLVDREIPFITDEWADPTKGSGCVKITPAHDPNDYEVGLRHSLPMINVLTADGKIARIVEPDGQTNPHSGNYEGLPFSTEGRRKVVSVMKAKDLLHDVEDHHVEIGHSDRSKLPIEPYLSDQWFVKTEDIPEPQASACASTRTQPEPQASACASTQEPTEPWASARASARRSTTSPSFTPFTPDLSIGATLLTWTTYGTWLPGDDRGSVSRAPRREGIQALRNLPGEPYDNDDPTRRNMAAERMEGQPVYLTAEHAMRLLDCVMETCERHGVELLAVAIMRDHVHILCQSEQHGRELLQLLKGNASRILNEEFHLSGAPRWWSNSGSRRRIKPGTDLTAAIDYVKKQSSPLCVWSFDMASGKSAQIVRDARHRVQTGGEDAGDVIESGTLARAKARGSGGITLGDGSKAPGLAQAAMDVVENGRIQIFPQRYAKTYLDWLREKRDWCISRQLWWGHRIHVAFTTFTWNPDEPISSTEARIAEECISKINDLLESCAHESTARFRKAETSAGGLWPWYLCGISGEDDEVLAQLKKITEAKTLEDIDEAVATLKVRFGDQVADKARALGTSGKIQRLERDEDVLDTWFSSALWPFSTLGWPEETPHLKRYYPVSVLCTSRDIITNWVARMVMFGLYTMGEVPFDHVYVHPKILDGRGETMSKSKGNGVDPLDIIHTHGADALRYTMADICTETQDIRMPVEYVCPHCDQLVDQTVVIKAETQARKSRGEKLERKLQPADCHRVTCTNKQCGRKFATQWAEESLKQELGLARETSDKFDTGRNFCNKLWNAARFSFMNLEGTPCEPIAIDRLLPEDRWILTRLSQTIRRYHECLQHYQFSASIKALRDFFWDSLCDWYIELTKPRLTPEPQASACASTQEPTEPQASACASTRQPQASTRAELSNPSDPVKQVLAFCLDQVLRLWHPTMPFMTERLWGQLNTIVPTRGLPGIVDLKTDSLLVHAEFPPEQGYPPLEDEGIIQLFEEIQQVVRAVRDLRLQCHVSPREAVTATVVLPENQCRSFEDQSHIVRRMAHVKTLTVVSSAKRPVNAGSITRGSLRVYVHDISNDEAERARTNKALQQLEKQITDKQSKLNNEKFIAHAKPDIVEAERKRLEELLIQQSGLQQHLDELNG